VLVPVMIGGLAPLAARLDLFGGALPANIFAITSSSLQPVRATAVVVEKPVPGRGP
jgi:hypothetical protein